MFYDDEPEILPWDYFLTDYERDLLKLNADHQVIRKKYPLVSMAQIEKDIEAMKALNAGGGE